jgi:hypothetical protein
MQASMSGLGGVNALMWMCDGDGLIITSPTASVLGHMTSSLALCVKKK